MKYFVTGATGFVGGAVVRQLVDAGHEVVALARQPSQTMQLRYLGVDIRQGDVTELETMRTPMAGVDGVFHIAGWYKIGARDPRLGWEINVEGTRNVLTLARDLEIPKVVYTSTLAVNSDTHSRIVDETYRHAGPWVTEYDRTKWIAHYEVADPLIAEGLPLVIVMPGMVYGPGDTSQMHEVFERWLRGRWPIAPRGTAYCWGHIEDTARGHLLAMERGEPGESYIIAGPPHSVIEAFEIAGQVTGIKPPPIRLGISVVRALATVSRLTERLHALPDLYSSEALRDSAGVTYLGSSAKARRDLGFTARPLAQGFRDYLPTELARLDHR
jgi:nucleoside-diphosphate-sugar epimerase